MKERKFRIGSLELKNPFLLAPLAGITDKTMRSLCAEAGASLVYTEMISAKGLWFGDSNTESLLETGTEEGPVAVQLFGGEPGILERAVRCLCTGERMRRGEIVEHPYDAAGQAVDAPGTAGRPALIDLNAGCPVPKIVRNGEGSALLKDMDRLYDAAEAMVRGARTAAETRGFDAAGGDTVHGTGEGAIPVTAKFRIGFARGENISVEAAKALEAAGVSAITVHGRTREQYYEGKADWRAIAEVKKAVRIPVIGNGDVRTGEDAIRMIDETGCDGVMIARGALGNPWIFREAKAIWEGGTHQPPVQEERIAMLMRHLDMAVADKGRRKAVREMRKHIAWYTKGMHGAASVRREVNHAVTAEDMKRILRRLT